MNAPLEYMWDGEAFHVRQRYQKAADAQFVIGQLYRLEVVEERSLNSHSHYFAALNEAWSNLPDDVAERFLTSDHLRRYALIKAGFCDERSILCASKADAQRHADFIRPMDTYAIIDASECVVRVRTAKSQSFRAMGRDEFQRSKTAVLEIVAAMIGASVESLQSNASKAA